jgi:hypothetical protein
VRNTEQSVFLLFGINFEKFFPGRTRRFFLKELIKSERADSPPIIARGRNPSDPIFLMSKLKTFFFFDNDIRANISWCFVRRNLILRLIYTRVRFRIRLVCVFKRAKKFCSYEWAKLIQNWPLKSDV